MMQVSHTRGTNMGAGSPNDGPSPVNGTGRGPDSAAARYEVIERAGEGTLWVAYRVRDRNTGRIHALKALKSTFARHAAFSPALTQVVQRSLDWSHPRLTATYEVGEEEGTLYFVSDWVGGGSLEHRLRRAPLGRSEALSIVRQIAEGLEYLHGRGTIHGDLRPRQILLIGDGNLKLTEAGQAQAFLDAKLNPVDIISDAAYYQAPERWDNRPLSASTDLYALGVILYRMLTGRMPFEGSSPLAIARKHHDEMPLRPSQINPHCPSDLERIAMRLLEKDPQSRYVSAAHLLRDLSPRPNTDAQGNDVPNGTVSAPAMAAAAIGAAGAGAVAAGAVTANAAGTGAAGVAAAGLADDVADTPKRGRRRAAPVQPVFPDDAEEEELTEEQQKQADRVGRKRHRRREAIGALLAIFWTLIAIGLLGGIVYGAYYFWVQDLPKEIKVPEYRGQNQDQAERVLANRGLKLRITREVYDPKKETGTVIGGDPPPGKTVRVGREINVTVSRGPEPIQMYDFTELTLQQARQIVLRDGLRLGQIAQQYHDKIPDGYICGQYPEPGETFRRSDPINLIVSKGPQPSGDVPDPAQLPPPPEVTPQSTDQPSFSSPSQDSDVTLVSRAVQVRVVIPKDGDRQEVRVIVRDADGEHTVYRKTHNPGDLVDETIQVTRQQGTTALVRIYVGGSLLREERV